MANPGRTFKSRNSTMDYGTKWMPKKSLHWSKSSHILAHYVGCHSDSLRPLTLLLMIWLPACIETTARTHKSVSWVRMCVGPPASTMNLHWQTETGPHAPPKHCQAPFVRDCSTLLSCPTLLWKETVREREGGSSETNERSSPAEDIYTLTYFFFFLCQHLLISFCSLQLMLEILSFRGVGWGWGAADWF